LRRYFPAAAGFAIFFFFFFIAMGLLPSRLMILRQA
jgi:hypothetical protein